MKNGKFQCPVREKINAYCSCPKIECERHGLCCECIINHKKRVGDPIEKRLPHCLRELIREVKI